MLSFFFSSYPYVSLPPINPKNLKEFQFPPFSLIYVFVCVSMHVVKLKPLDVSILCQILRRITKWERSTLSSSARTSSSSRFLPISLLLCFLFFCLVIGKVKESENKMMFLAVILSYWKAVWLMFWKCFVSLNFTKCHEFCIGFDGIKESIFFFFKKSEHSVVIICMV